MPPVFQRHLVLGLALCLVFQSVELDKATLSVRPSEGFGEQSFAVLAGCFPRSLFAINQKATVRVDEWAVNWLERLEDLPRHFFLPAVDFVDHLIRTPDFFWSVAGLVAAGGILTYMGPQWMRIQIEWQIEHYLRWAHYFKRTKAINEWAYAWLWFKKPYYGPAQITQLNDLLADRIKGRPNTLEHRALLALKAKVKREIIGNPMVYRSPWYFLYRLWTSWRFLQPFPWHILAIFCPGIPTRYSDISEDYLNFAREIFLSVPEGKGRRSPMRTKRFNWSKRMISEMPVLQDLEQIPVYQFAYEVIEGAIQRHHRRLVEIVGRRLVKQGNWVLVHFTEVLLWPWISAGREFWIRSAGKPYADSWVRKFGVSLQFLSGSVGRLQSQEDSVSLLRLKAALARIRDPRSEPNGELQNRSDFDAVFLQRVQAVLAGMTGLLPEPVDDARAAAEQAVLRLPDSLRLRLAIPLHFEFADGEGGEELKIGLKVNGLAELANIASEIELWKAPPNADTSVIERSVVLPDHGVWPYQRLDVDLRRQTGWLVFGRITEMPPPTMNRTFWFNQFPESFQKFIAFPPKVQVFRRQGREGIKIALNTLDPEKIADLRLEIPKMLNHRMPLGWVYQGLKKEKIYWLFLEKDSNPPRAIPFGTLPSPPTRSVHCLVAAA